MKDNLAVLIVAVILVLTVGYSMSTMLETMTWNMAMRRVGISMSVLGAFALIYILHKSEEGTAE